VTHGTPKKNASSAPARIGQDHRGRLLERDHVQERLPRSPHARQLIAEADLADAAPWSADARQHHRHLPRDFCSADTAPSRAGSSAFSARWQVASEASTFDAERRQHAHDRGRASR
jgi:hypothetical protein